MILHITGNQVETIYNEILDLRALGAVSIRRASHVEPTKDGYWFVDLTPAGGPVLAGFEKRSQALAAEVVWLETHLCPMRPETSTVVGRVLQDGVPWDDDKGGADEVE